MTTRFALGLIVGVLTVLALTHPVQAGQWTTVFRDDFQGTELDASQWRVDQAQGTYSVSEGFLRMRSGGGIPVIRSRLGVVPATGDLRVTIGFQYVSSTQYGSGLGLEASSSYLAECPVSPPIHPWYGVQHDNQHRTTACAHPVTAGFGDCGVNNSCMTLDVTNLAYHVLQLTFTDQGVHASVDGSTAETWTGVYPRPDVVWFGGADDPSWSFSEYDVDFVQIDIFEFATPTPRSTWSKLKLLYR